MTEPERRDEPGDDPVEVAREAAAAGPLAERVSELETHLSAERAEGARRLKEMDALMRQTRSALHDLQGEFRRCTSERDELRSQLQVRDREVHELETKVRELREKAERATTEREGSTAEVVAAAIARAQRAEAELARARNTIVTLHERVRELEHGDAGDGGSAAEKIAQLKRGLALREQELIRAAEKIQEFEERLAAHAPAGAERHPAEPAAPREPARGASPDDAYETSADPVAVGHGGSSTYIPIDAEQSVSPAAPPSDESGTYFPVAAPSTVDTQPPMPLADAGGASPRIVVTKKPSPRRRPPANLPVLEGLSIEREVARDEDGVLLFARDDATDRGVAVRVLPRGTVRPSSSSVERLTAIRHHNLAAVLRCDLGPDGPYVVSERPAGERADAWIRRVGGVPERIALAAVTQAARGLREAAGHGLHHGDLSPATLWMDTTGVVRVTGLGLRELVPHRDERASPAYVAPERRRGDAPDARSDTYSLGACLRFLVGGHAAAEEPERLRAARPRVSARLIELADALCAADRDERPADWDDVIARLEACLQQTEDAEAAAGSAGSWPARLVARPHLLVGALALIALIVAGCLHVFAG